MLFHTYLDLLPLNLVYFVLENGNSVLENNISLAVGTMNRSQSGCLYYTVILAEIWEHHLNWFRPIVLLIMLKARILPLDLYVCVYSVLPAMLWEDSTVVSKYWAVVKIGMSNQHLWNELSEHRAVTIFGYTTNYPNIGLYNNNKLLVQWHYFTTNCFKYELYIYIYIYIYMELDYLYVTATGSINDCVCGNRSRDGWSQWVLFQQLFSLYTCRSGIKSNNG